MRQILVYLKPYLLRMSMGLSIKFAGTLMDLFLPWILAYMIDSIAPQKDTSLIFIWGGVMVLCSVVAVVANIVANRMASAVARDTSRAIRHDLYEKTMALSFKQTDEATVPSLISRLTSDTYNVHQMLGMMQRLGVRAPILLIGGIVVTLMLDPILSLVLIATLPFITYVVYFISKRGIPLFSSLQQAVDQLVRTVRENITGIRVIKALSKAEYEKERFNQVNGSVVEREQKANITMAASNPLMNLFLNVGLILVIIVGAYRVDSGLSEPGKIIAFLSYFTIILNAMLSITRMFVMFSRGSASAARITRILESPEDLTRQRHPKTRTDAHIIFDRVSFSYHKKEDNLTDISFSLNRGETLGIIGPTGCGKTTLIQLLLRFYDVDSGAIYIDGSDVRSLTEESLRARIGIAFQNDILFADSIANNIDFGRGLTRENIAEAAKHAQAQTFIEALPDSYDHMLTIKGSNLSGGQKQRLLIARALAAKPEILILDDSSSALDYKTDALLRKAIKEHFGGTTTIIITPRVSSIRGADHIMCLEDGKIIGYGTHAELLQSCPSYYATSQLQMGDDLIEQNEAVN